jgi:hypothetical protein
MRFMPKPVPLPIACTLTGASLQERAAWLRRLGEAALIEGTREGNHLALRFRPEAAADVCELVRAESECCAFLSFEVEPGVDEVVLTVTGPSDTEPVLDALLAQLRFAEH